MRLGQGRENAKQYLRDNPALADEISKKVLEKRGLLAEPVTRRRTAKRRRPPSRSAGQERNPNRRQAAVAE